MKRGGLRSQNHRSTEAQKQRKKEGTKRRTKRREGEATGDEKQNKERQTKDEKEKESTAVRFELTRVTPIDFESIALTARPSCHDNPPLTPHQHTNTHKKYTTHHTHQQHTAPSHIANTQMPPTTLENSDHIARNIHTHTHTHQSNRLRRGDGPTTTETQCHQGWGTIDYYNNSATTTNQPPLSNLRAIHPQAETTTENSAHTHTHTHTHTLPESHNATAAVE